MIKAFIFDFDGLILDTETTEYRAFYQLAMQYGVELHVEQWLKWVGTLNGKAHAMEYVYQQLVKTKAQLSIEELEDSFQKLFEELILKQNVLPGVRELLILAKRYQLRLGIASSSDMKWVSRFLHQHQLNSYFDHIQTRDHVKKVKPDPEIYQKALYHLQVEASEAIAFEDSEVGSTAAKRAGIACVVVPNLITQHQNFEHVDLVVSSMEVLNIELLIKKQFH